MLPSALSIMQPLPQSSSSSYNSKHNVVNLPRIQVPEYPMLSTPVATPNLDQFSQKQQQQQQVRNPSPLPSLESLKDIKSSANPVKNLPNISSLNLPSSKNFPPSSKNSHMVLPATPLQTPQTSTSSSWSSLEDNSNKKSSKSSSNPNTTTLPSLKFLGEGLLRPASVSNTSLPPLISPQTQSESTKSMSPVSRTTPPPVNNSSSSNSPIKPRTSSPLAEPLNQSINSQRPETDAMMKSMTSPYKLANGETINPNEPYTQMNPRYPPPPPPPPHPSHQQQMPSYHPPPPPQYHHSQPHPEYSPDSSRQHPPPMPPRDPQYPYPSPYNQQGPLPPHNQTPIPHQGYGPSYSPYGPSYYPSNSPQGSPYPHQYNNYYEKPQGMPPQHPHHPQESSQQISMNNASIGLGIYAGHNTNGPDYYAMKQLPHQHQMHPHLPPHMSPQQMAHHQLQHQSPHLMNSPVMMQHQQGYKTMIEGQPTREIKRRTKTGCLTCRKRRIKCDETHPTCFNCDKSKRVCLNYDPVFQFVGERRGSRSPRQYPENSGLSSPNNSFVSLTTPPHSHSSSRSTSGASDIAQLSSMVKKEEDDNQEIKDEESSRPRNRMDISSLLSAAAVIEKDKSPKDDNKPELMIRKRKAPADDDSYAESKPWYETFSCNRWDVLEKYFAYYIAFELDGLFGTDRFSQIPIGDMARSSGLSLDGSSSMTIPGSNSSSRGANTFATAMFGNNAQFYANSNGSSHPPPPPSTNCTVRIGQNLAILEAVRQLMVFFVPNCAHLGVGNLTIDESSIGKLEELRISNDYKLLRAIVQMVQGAPTKRISEFLNVSERDEDLFKKIKILYKVLRFGYLDNKRQTNVLDMGPQDDDKVQVFNESNEELSNVQNPNNKEAKMTQEKKAKEAETTRNKAFEIIDSMKSGEESKIFNEDIWTLMDFLVSPRTVKEDGELKDSLSDDQLAAIIAFAAKDIRSTTSSPTSETHPRRAHESVHGNKKRQKHSPEEVRVLVGRILGNGANYKNGSLTGSALAEVFAIEQGLEVNVSTAGQSTEKPNKKDKQQYPVTSSLRMALFYALIYYLEYRKFMEDTNLMIKNQKPGANSRNRTYNNGKVVKLMLAEGIHMWPRTVVNNRFLSMVMI